jgi:GNAT superfamily N-acetyltransferase
MVIRAARPDEGDALREIAVAAKGFWGYDEALVRSWAASLDLSPGRLATAHAFVAEADGRAVGWAEVLPPQDGVCVLEHLWVEPGSMRRGVGSRLFRHAAGRARELGAASMEWEAEPHALGFYARMGAEPVGTATSEWGRELPVMGVSLAR